MNENNEIITMEDEKVASMLQKMRKSSRWLSGFLESYRPPLDGEGQGSGRPFTGKPPYSSGIP